uniref:Ovule protein n=1 Tax=Ascaris lumbricoides TaxID=6252 RepID=A0A0M3HYS8_ASCLU
MLITSATGYIPSERRKSGEIIILLEENSTNSRHPSLCCLLLSLCCFLPPLPSSYPESMGRIQPNIHTHTAKIIIPFAGRHAVFSVA